MTHLSFRNGFRKAIGRKTLGAAAAGLLVPLLISSQELPQPSARLEPATLTASLAHDGAPVDLTTTLTNAGTAPLAWRVGAIRDVSAETAPAVATGPVAAAKVYARANVEREIADGEIIVGLKETSGTAPAAPTQFLGGRCKVKKELARARRAGRARGGERGARPGRKLYLVSVEDKSKAGIQKAIDELRLDPKVAYAEPNYRVKAIGLPNDPDFGLLYGLHNLGQTKGIEDADIDAPEAWDTHTGGDNVVVGVIDTGIDYLHPDLAENMWVNPGEIPGNGLDDDGNGYVDDVHGYDFVNDDPDPMDDHFHGTHVAGTIAAVGNNGIGITGVAWQAKVAALKFLDAGGSGNLDDAIEAVAYANAMNIPITNNSWGGGGFSQALKDVIDAAGERGFLFVAAAGNSSSDNDVFPAYPASYESANILSIAATDHGDEMAFFSSFGATTVDLGAPGVDTYSCFPGGGYDFLSGTSMATPHVAGAAALIRSYNPQLGQAEIKAALLAGVDPIPSLAGKTLSGGRLNLAKAIGGVSPPWLTVAPRGPGSLEAGASKALTATVNPRGLTAGRHRGLVTLITDDPVQPSRDLEVVVDVSGCRSLAADPASLDFGPVWRTTSRRMTVILRNACNDFTTVSAVESSSGEFSAVGTFPLRVPPFGAVAVELAYAPADLGEDAATATFRSDAADHPALAIAVRGSGVEPPAVAANPSDFALTLDPAERARRTLTVSNTGGDALSVDLRTAAPKAGAAARKPSGAARIIPGRRGQGSPYAAAAAAGKLGGNLKPAFKASAAGLRVLYLTTLLPTGGEDQFTTGLRGLGNVGSLEVLDGFSGTPNVDYLLGFDAVLVSSNSGWSNPTALGNALADYVDQGGTLGLLVAAIASGGGYGLQGRITGPDYMPIDMQGAGRGGQAVAFETHPVTAGVSMIECALPTAARSVRGRGISLGAYSAGNLVGAVNPDKPIVALNIFPSDFFWGGDVILMLGNTLDYLAGAASWLKIEPRRAVIPPGGSFDFTLNISAEGQLAGEHRSAVEISHNAPSGDNPLAVPVVLEVRPLSRLALSHVKHDFGGILVGGRASTTVSLTNSGNRATTVSSIEAEGDFASAAPAPFEVPAFSSVDVDVVFTPREEGGDIGALTYRSDAADNPELRIALRGRGLPAPLAALEPARLTVALAHDGAPRDLVSVLSNAGRGVLHYQVTSVQDLTPPPAARRAMAVAAERIYRAANYDLPAVAGELIVGLKEGKEGLADAAALSGRAQVKRALGRAKAPRGKVSSWKPPRKLLLVTLADPSKAGVLKAIEDLRRDAHVAYAEPNYRVKAVAVPNDPDFGLLWGLHNEGQSGGVADADVDAPEAWDIFTGEGGEGGAVVGVIDTGIDYLHPDLAANVWTNAGEIPANGLDDDGNGFVDDVHGYDFVNEDGDPMDDHYHGTHVAGTIAAVGNNGIGVAGVAWKAKVAGLKFLDAGGFGSTEDAIEAVAYANAMGISITNNSWGGGGYSQALKDVIDAGGALGHLFVAAAGNASNDNDAFPSYPATYESDNILSVAATDHGDLLAFFSSYGATTVDLGAPGVDTYSLAPGAGYQYLSGTSMATPHVAGAAALLKGYNASLGYVEIKAALLGSVDPIPALAGITLTGGRLNVRNAFAGVSPPWLVVSPRAPGSVEPGASTPITATVDPAGLTAGEHRGIATLTTDDPAHSTLTLEVVASISGCKSIAADRASLDFGTVWLGATGRMAVVLKNACNDFTTVSAVESGHRTFAPATALPLVIPPFGTAVLEILYTPDDLKADKATLTLRSDAGDHPVLKVAAKGNGVKPPAIAVDPAQVSLTMDPSRQKAFGLKLANKGGADLLATLSVKPVRPASSAALAPKVATLERKAGKRYGRFQRLDRPTRLHPTVRSAAADLRVLYLTTLWQPDGGDMFVQGLRGLPQVGLLDVLDGSTQVPNADYLQGYDIVIVSADYPWADAVATGDVLADYVDDGGRVALMTAAIASGGGYELQGRMGGPGYMPIVKEGPGYYGVANSFADHPITAGLAAIECAIPTAATSVQGGALALGQYDNGSLLGAVHEDKAIVALNVYPGDYAWAGDVILMMSNTLDFLADFSAWVKVEPRDLRVAPGKSASAHLLFDTGKLEAGTYSAVLSVGHNAPSGANPFTVPVTLTVRAKSCLEASTATVNFGKVWTGRNASAVITLANPCNRPTVIQSFAVAGKTFATSASAPLTVAPFSETSIEVGYTPDDLSADKGELKIKSDAQEGGQIKVALAGTGVRPPAISVRPASLLATLDPGVKAERTLEIRNTGGDSLRLKVTANAVEEETPPSGKAAVIPGPRAGARPLVGEVKAPLAYTSPRKFRGQASNLRILYLYGHSMSDSSGSEVEDTFTRGLRGLANVGTLDLLDVRWQTPNAEYLQAYDIVLVSSDWGFSDPYLLGDTMADYVDAGGKVVLLASSWHAWYPFGLEGRFASPDYLPIERAWSDWDAHSPVLVDHPINAGVTAFSSLIYMGSWAVQGAGQSLGQYQNGSLTGAYHADKPIVALNVFPVDGFWGGDVLLLMGNAFDWLGSGVRWMKPAVADLVVPPGQSRNLTVEFNTGRMEAGEFRGLLALDHNAPAVPAPLEVPVTLTVRSKRCLSLDTDSLDFGEVWRGGTSQGWFSLVNGCNEATRVSAIGSGDAAFTVNAGLPLEVPAFGSVQVEVAFSPATAGPRRSLLEIESDAQDHAELRLAVSGSGILPPAISVTPTSFSESVPAGGAVTRPLTVSNPGGDFLYVDIRKGLPVPDSGLPALAKVRAAAPGKPWSPRNMAATSFRRAVDVPKARAEGLRVLYVTTILPDSGYDDWFTWGVRYLPQVGSLEVLNAEFQTPNAAYLRAYDVVIVASAFPFADAAALGDALADYVDAGGRVCLMTAAISDSEGLGLAGRIATPAYMPMTMAGPAKGGMATRFEDHPINQGVYYLYSDMPTASTSVQGDGRPLGWLDNGILLGAYSPAKPVVALNVFPADYGWKGDLIPMMGNILDHLDEYGNFLRFSPRYLYVPAGGSAEVQVTLDGSRVGAGIHTGHLTLSHSAPDAAPVTVSATLEVAARRSLAVSARALDFGDVVLGDRKVLGLIVSNTGNLPVTVTSERSGSGDFALAGAAFPLELGAGAAVRLEMAYEPGAHGPAEGEIAFAAEGAGDPLRVSLAGRGLRPADLAAAPSPAPLRFTVTEGGQASGSLALTNLGDEGLRYRLDVLAGPGAGSPESAAKAAYGPSHHAPLVKGSLDTRVGNPVDLAAGGPDGFGHRWMDSRSPEGPAFAWTDIAATGRRLEAVSGCDDCAEEVPLSFAFPLYRESGFDAMFVSSNGYVTFGAPSEAFGNHPIPSPSLPGNLVAALFQDLYPAGGEGVFFQDFGDRAVVQYAGVPDFHGTGSYDFQIVLFPDGTVDFLYRSLTGVKNTATVGIQDGTAADGLGVVYNADFLEDSLAVRIRTWVTVPDRAGALAGEEGKALPVSLDSRGLAPGTHRATLSLTAEASRPRGPETALPPMEVPVEITVTPAAEAARTP